MQFECPTCDDKGYVVLHSNLADGYGSANCHCWRGDKLQKADERAGGGKKYKQLKPGDRLVGRGLFG